MITLFIVGGIIAFTFFIAVVMSDPAEDTVSQELPAIPPLPRPEPERYAFYERIEPSDTHSAPARAAISSPHVVDLSHLDSRN